MEFITYNPNPSNWKTGDCVIRALTKAEDLDWETVYKELCEIGLKKHRMPNDDIVYEKWLSDRGWVRQKQVKYEDGTKYTIENFIDKFSVGRKVLVTCAHHIICAEDGKEYDLSPVRYKTANKWYIKEN